MSETIASLEPTEFRDKKFSLVFKWFDQNADGWVTKDDMEQMIKRFTSIAEETDQKNRNAMRSENNTGEKLGKEEFSRAMYSVVAHPERWEAGVGGLIDGMLGALDKDGNGTISYQEYLGLYKALGVPQNHSIEAFALLDRDHDGQIDRGEFDQALREYYLGGDPKAPGNWLLGPPDQPL